MLILVLVLMVVGSGVLELDTDVPDGDFRGCLWSLACLRKNQRSCYWRLTV